MFCPRCGSRAPDNANACTLCGLVLRPDAEGIAFRPDPASPGLSGLGTVAPVMLPGPIVSLVTYGGFWRRFAGFVIDATILLFPAAIVRVLLGRAATSGFEVDVPVSWLALGLEMAIGWAYAAALISSGMRGTLGQQVMDLHVTDMDGGRVSFARATLRWAAQVLNLFTLGFGLVLQLISPRRQALHDLVSGTVVVRPRRAAHPAQPGYPAQPGGSAASTGSAPVPGFVP